MSFNVHDFRDDRSAAARVVRAVAPDVLCLQEVPRRLTTELRVPRFARACGLVWHRGRLGTGGTAVMTRPGVVVHEVVRGRLPVRFPDRTRGYAGASVSLPADGLQADPVTVVSIHLGLREEERSRHAAMVLEALGERAVVAGDLNEEPGGTAYDLVAARYPRASAGEATFPARNPTTALDAVFAASALRVVPSEPVLLQQGDLELASDHRPVWIDLDMGSSAGRSTG